MLKEIAIFEEIWKKFYKYMKMFRLFEIDILFAVKFMKLFMLGWIFGFLFIACLKESKL